MVDSHLTNKAIFIRMEKKEAFIESCVYLGSFIVSVFLDGFSYDLTHRTFVFSIRLGEGMKYANCSVRIPPPSLLGFK